MTRQHLLIVAALSLALGALMTMFTPFLRSFSLWHIEGPALWTGGFIIGLLCCVAIHPARKAFLSLFIILAIATLIQGLVIYSPALLNMALNRTAYFRAAESLTSFTCLVLLPIIIPGALSGLVIRTYLDTH